MRAFLQGFLRLCVCVSDSARQSFAMGNAQGGGGYSKRERIASEASAARAALQQRHGRAYTNDEECPVQVSHKPDAVSTFKKE